MAIWMQTLIVIGGTGGSFRVGPDDGINNRIEVTSTTCVPPGHA